MGDDVITGSDGKPRCSWAGAGDTALGRYHDEVWGTRTYDESALFEALTLGVFQAGLSWSIVFGKRDAFRKALHGFDIARAFSAVAWILAPLRIIEGSCSSRPMSRSVIAATRATSKSWKVFRSASRLPNTTDQLSPA